MNYARRFRVWLRHLEPRVLDTLNGPFLKRLRPWLEQHDVFNFSRRPLAIGVAVGMFCGLIPGPLQVLGSVLLCAGLRANVIAAALATAYTNPLTIVPLYWVAFEIGQSLLPGQHAMPPFVAPQAGLGAWGQAMAQWISALGWPLMVGLPILAAALALCAYVLVQAFFLVPILLRARRMASSTNPGKLR
jgi:uncharacterized protein (DUF2062 family)